MTSPQSKNSASEKSPDERLRKLISGMIAFIRTPALVAEIDELVAQGANVNGPQGKGELLLLAVRNCNAAAVHELLVRGADPRLQVEHDGEATTLLHVAVQTDRPSHRVILLLLAAGMDPYEEKDSKRMSAKNLAITREGLSAVFSYPLHSAVKCNDIALCAEFLRRGFDPHNGDHRGDTPAGLAKSIGLKDIAALFDAAQASRAVDALLKESLARQRP